ncbi:DUF805 domain-containing protein [Uliginosibacterium sp. H1]|uniref:DUF805 domain-containing protein n=1 Tax=Uliginosibacterium sp. H1 TaxID=3114757 RepID=UPI002E17DC21|nr:DUF805 domain-containing protein [Uliginosibacterium sp. H1]
MDWYLGVLKKYFVFEGRARRKELWMFTLFNFIAIIVLSIIDGMLGLKVGDIGILGGIYNLAVLLPSLGVGARRLHDSNHSGWWLLLCLVPIVGAIALLVFFVLDSTPGSNRFGPNPKGVEAIA